MLRVRASVVGDDLDDLARVGVGEAAGERDGVPLAVDHLGVVRLVGEQGFGRYQRLHRSGEPVSVLNVEQLPDVVRVGRVLVVRF